jgi:hypothetical protein
MIFGSLMGCRAPANSMAGSAGAIVSKHSALLIFSVNFVGTRCSPRGDDAGFVLVVLALGTSAHIAELGARWRSGRRATSDMRRHGAGLFGSAFIAT